MRKSLFLSFLLFLLLIPFSVYANHTIMVVSDLHYCSPSLYEGSDLFLRSIAQGDGKMVHKSDVLLEALLLQAQQIRPDVLLLTGDLTFNGEAVSHQELAQHLDLLADQGIAVFVIPGNHDINCRAARAFQGNSYTAADTVEAKEFRRIYHRFLGTITQDNIGISYTSAPYPDLVLCMLDCAFYEPDAYAFGLLDEARYAWLQNVLNETDLDRCFFLSATHHSVIPHSSLGKENFVILNAERIAGALRAHHVPLHLSGHLHIQHIAEESGLYDIASGAFSVFPHRYGLITVDDSHSVSYQALPLDETLLPSGFMQESEQWFRNTTRIKTEPALDALNISGPDKEIMLQYAEDLNLAYFSGTLVSGDAAWKEREGYRLWMEYADRLAFGQYLNLILSEAGTSSLMLNLP